MMTVYVSKSDPNDKIWAEIDDNPFYKGYYVKLKSDTAPFQVEGDAFEMRYKPYHEVKKNRPAQ